MPVDQPASDPSQWQTAADALGATLDRARSICLLDPDPAACRAALAGLANSAGGYLLLGVTADGAAGHVQTVAGIDANRFAAELGRLTASIDPPIGELVSARELLGADGRALVVVSVRQSMQCPHLDSTTGSTFVIGEAGPVPIRTRAALDRLYQKGRSADERAERSIQGMLDRLQLASFGHFGIAVVAALRQPTGAPYLWWCDHLDELASPADPFVQVWDFNPKTARVRPAEIELRLDREVTGILRVTRGGCVVAAEILRRPQNNVLGTPEEIEQRLRLLLGTVSRMLGPAAAAEVVPRLLCEGLKTTTLRLNGDPPATSQPATVDALLVPGPAGDAGDAAYRELLLARYRDQIRAVYQIEPVAAAAESA